MPTTKSYRYAESESAEICKLLLENIRDKNLANDAQLIEPLRLAIFHASTNRYPYRAIMFSEICKVLWSFVKTKMLYSICLIMSSEMAKHSKNIWLVEIGVKDVKKCSKYSKV